MFQKDPNSLVPVDDKGQVKMDEDYDILDTWQVCGKLFIKGRNSFFFAPKGARKAAAYRNALINPSKTTVLDALTGLQSIQAQLGCQMSYLHN